MSRSIAAPDDGYNGLIRGKKQDRIYKIKNDEMLIFIEEKGGKKCFIK